MKVFKKKLCAYYLLLKVLLRFLCFLETDAMAIVMYVHVPGFVKILEGNKYVHVLVYSFHKRGYLNQVNMGGLG